LKSQTQTDPYSSFFNISFSIDNLVNPFNISCDFVNLRYDFINFNFEKLLFAYATVISIVNKIL